LWLISKWPQQLPPTASPATRGKGTAVPTLAIVNEAPTDPGDKALLAQFQKHLTRPLDPLRLAESIMVLADRRRRKREISQTRQSPSL
jgi:hypothetical protein